MIKIDLDPSLRNVKEKDIFEECANDFKKKSTLDTKTHALQHSDDVQKCSDSYKTNVPYNIANLYTVPNLPVEHYKKIYEQKFRNQQDIREKYYDKLMARITCPVCGCGRVKNLDHFLPISEFPLLCVTPINLVPTCRDCNMEKNASTGTSYHDIPFHPYFETINDVFLECDIKFHQDGTIEFDFKNCYNGNSDMKKKYEKHISINNLNDTYFSRALSTLNSQKSRFRELLHSAGKYSVSEDLLSFKKSADIRDINSWESAVYHSLNENIDDFCDWLDTPDVFC